MPPNACPNSLSVVVRDLAGDDIVIGLDLEEVAGSTGSACTTGSTEPSHVLSAMGYPPAEARGSLRLSMGRSTTDEDVDTAIEVVPAVIDHLRDGQTRLDPGVTGMADRV